MAGIRRGHNDGTPLHLLGKEGVLTGKSTALLFES